jgi:hypothetical protein
LDLSKMNLLQRQQSMLQGTLYHCCCCYCCHPWLGMPA